MRTEQKIILSLYYTDPRVRSSIDEAELSVGMDVSQLLFLMEGAFHKVEYKYYIEDGKIQSKPAEDRREEYMGMVEQDNPELKQAGVLAVECGGQKDFQDTDYLEIDSQCGEVSCAKEYLYFLNILVRSINGTRLLTERDNQVFYRLYSDRSGKEFVSCLLAMMLKFISTFLTGKREEADEVLQTINKDYELMQTVFREIQVFLDNMWIQEQQMKQFYFKNFFENQSRIFQTWVNDHQNVISQGDMLEFVFYRNKALKDIAFHLMLHIAKIARVLMKENEAEILWKECFALNNPDQVLGFYHLDRLVEKLEEEGGKESFDLIRWANEYITRLNEFSIELNLQ